MGRLDGHIYQCKGRGEGSSSRSSGGRVYYSFLLYIYTVLYSIVLYTYTIVYILL